jgi:hypothetical protein
VGGLGPGPHGPPRNPALMGPGTPSVTPGATAWGSGVSRIPSYKAVYGERASARIYGVWGSDPAEKRNFCHFNSSSTA